jgi:hypothetical protein
VTAVTTCSVRTRQGQLRRVEQALDIVIRAVGAATVSPGGGAFGPVHGDRRPEAPPLDTDKVAGEAALLLRATEWLRPVRRVADARDRLARLVAARVDLDEVAATLCLAPERAFDKAFTWLHLRDLGYASSDLDGLLAESLPAPSGPGPEQLPCFELERRWLRGLWNGDFTDLDDAALLARSALGRPVDALTARPEELYVLTHCVLYASDMGRRAPRVRVALEDAEAALAVALDADNLDLAAEVLWLWPMLGLPWRAPAALALRVLDEAYDAHGLLTGPGYDAAHRDALPADEATDYDLRSSYHATLAYGILCAALLEHPVAPAARARSGSTREVALPPGRDSRWQAAYADLGPDKRVGLADFVLTVTLRRARDAHDLAALRRVLETAVSHDLADRPAAQHAAGLLRRAALLSRCDALAG